MKKFLKKLPFWRNFTTNQWQNWWAKRDIDWKVSYFDTWNHPHRFMISGILKNFNWLSLLEVGCGAGANLVNIVKHFPGRQIGGVDINPEAVKIVNESFNGAFTKVCAADDIMMSDSSTDVVLTDMTLIYYGPKRMRKAIADIKRVARSYVMFCEFHSESYFERLWLWITSGYHAHNYRKLLSQMGFFDVTLVKIPPEAWPGSDARQKFRYITLAKVPKRK